MNNNSGRQKGSSFFGGKEGESIRKAVKNKDVSSLIGGLSPEDMEILTALMNNKEARDKLLSSPEALRLISELMNGR